MAHVFGERTLATLERLLSLLSAFEVVVWMTDGWPLYESRLKGKLHVMETPHYHRRYGVSLLSSAWGQVGPPRYCRQANSVLSDRFCVLI